jgi:hypothetical protein
MNDESRNLVDHSSFIIHHSSLAVTIKSQIEYHCPNCQGAWLPYAAGLACPYCKRALPDSEVTGIVAEALESARYNKQLYGRFDLEYWMARRLGDKYLAWGFKALQLAEADPQSPARNIAIAALMELDLEEMAAHREHAAGFLAALIEAYRAAIKADPKAWEKIPEPEKPFFGRKTIEDR